MNRSNIVQHQSIPRRSWHQSIRLFYSTLTHSHPRFHPITTACTSVPSFKRQSIVRVSFPSTIRFITHSSRPTNLPPDPSTDAYSNHPNRPQSASSLFKWTVACSLIGTGLYFGPDYWNIHHEEDVSEAVHRWIEAREREKTKQVNHSGPTTTSTSDASTSASSLPDLDENYSRTACIIDPRLLADLAAIHPSLSRMETRTRRLLRSGGFSLSNSLELMDYFNRYPDLVYPQAEVVRTSPMDYMGPPPFYPRQELEDMWSDEKRLRNHERNAFELLGLGRVLQSLAADSYYQHPIKDTQLSEIARTRLMEAMIMLKALSRFHCEKLNTNLTPPILLTTTVNTNPTSTHPSDHQSRPDSALIRRCQKLRLGLAEALMSLNQYAMAQAALDEYQNLWPNDPILTGQPNSLR